MEDVILTSYKYLRDSDTVLTGYRVVAKMEGNPDFADAPPALAATKKLLPAVLSAVNNAKGRDVEVVQLKNNLKDELVGLLTELAEYVTVKCKGDRLKLLSSGFPVSGASSTQVEQVIQELEVTLGASGVATTSVKRLRGARAYMHQYTTEPPIDGTVWHIEAGKHPQFKFVGLKSMEKYWFRVVAVAADGENITSPVVWRVIQ
ncbi:hypothetical protein A3860_38800 [Niastella vici]|uniref:Fibronectin type-III domain-containing protein n=1 Tax=Niastella vici TaxID=1703345 RepID=A0A1V9FLD6_9BACT|nr:hypothetical protein [Niastella vici]OQP59121.1 hypothetical protein A3860_38800 [Niastella vici]